MKANHSVYTFQGRIIRPAHRSLKNQWAAQADEIADVHGRVAVSVRPMPAARADIGVF